MKILALDSSAATATIALCEDHRLIAQSTLSDNNKHSETLLVMIKKMLALTGESIDDIDMFAVTVGPGSFTGIRIGISLIKGLTFGKDKQCIGISALEALAYNIYDTNGIICPIMDARREHVYNALFEAQDGALTRLCDDRLISIDELANELVNSKRMGITLVGDAYTAMRDKLSEHGIACSTPPLLINSNAYSVAMAAYEKYLSGQRGSDLELLPIYLRASQAERERLEKLENDQKVDQK